MDAKMTIISVPLNSDDVPKFTPSKLMIEKNFKNSIV